MKKRIQTWWNQVLIRKKIWMGLAASFLIVICTVMISFWLFYSYVNSFTSILNNQTQNQGIREAFSEEQNAFKRYVWDRKKEYREDYQAACARVATQIDLLPKDYSEIGQERYIETQSIVNGYEGYHRQIDELLLLDQSYPSFIPALYVCYDTQSYIEGYIDSLINTMLSEDSDFYNQGLAKTVFFPYLLLFLAILLIVCISVTVRTFLHLIVTPMLTLSDAAKEIANNNYAIADIPVNSQDEVGNLIREFNLMKHSTAGYIDTLREKSEMEKKLSDNEIHKLQTQQLLSEMKMQLLRNQINPHFLFNTLNIISGMARIEDAENTYEMTQRLSKLFRYNLKTESKIVPLQSEIDIAKDYFYIQRRRFGERIQIEWDIQADPTTTLIPVFTFQPLIENAIIHGITPKEDGGLIRIRLHKIDNRYHLYVMDNGLGVPLERLNQIQEELSKEQGSHIGIGVINVKARFQMLFPASRFSFLSRENQGTTIRIIWQDTKTR